MTRGERNFLISISTFGVVFMLANGVWFVLHPKAVINLLIAAFLAFSLARLWLVTRDFR